MFQAFSLNTKISEKNQEIYRNLQRKLLSQIDGFYFSEKHSPHLSFITVFVQSLPEIEDCKARFEAYFELNKLLFQDLRKSSLLIDELIVKTGDNGSGQLYVMLRSSNDLLLNRLDSLNLSLSKYFSDIHIPNYIEFMGEKWQDLEPEKQTLFKERSLFVSKYDPHMTIGKIKGDYPEIAVKLEEPLDLELDTFELTLSQEDNTFPVVRIFDTKLI